MGEKATVRNTPSLFEEKDDQKRHQHRRSKRDYEKQIEELTKDLASCKLQLEAKHAACMQALRKVEHYQKLSSELSILLKKSDTARSKHVNECTRDGRSARTSDFESMMKEIDDQHVGSSKCREQLSQLFCDLKATQSLLLDKEIELVAARDSELKALSKTEEMEVAFNIEKKKNEQLLQQLGELKLKKQTENQTVNDLNSNTESLTGDFQKAKERDVTSHTGKGEEAEESENERVTIPLKEYESLVRKVEKEKEARASMVEVGSQSEAAVLKMELEAATAKIGELRARAEQALSRAELAEKAKAALEDKLKRHREKRHRRKAAMAALEEESTPKQFTPSSSEATPKTYEPLSKVLNMKF